MADDLAKLLKGDGTPAGTDGAIMKSYAEPWYRRIPNNLTDFLYGPDANAKQAAGVRHLTGPENPLNLPAQIAEGVDTARQGYNLGDKSMMGFGAFEAAAALPIPGARGAANAAKAARSVDRLGYYSGALEAAKAIPQAKGTTEQMAAMLQKGGAKAGEIEATGLAKFLEGRPAVTRDEIVGHLEGNRLALNEAQYAPSGAYFKTPEEWEAAIAGAERSGNWNEVDRLTRLWEESAGVSPNAGTPKWQNYSLDPSNPTYRETVLHLPENMQSRFTPVEHPTKPGTFALVDASGNYKMADSQYHPNTPAWFDTEQYARNAAASDREFSELNPSMAKNFRSGHFSEPNIVGHTMTSINKHEGRPVFTIDQIQSDWGQKLRDGGVRDEGKIAQLKAAQATAQRTADEITEKFMEGLPEGDRSKAYRGDANDRLSQMSAKGDPVGMEWAKNWADARRLAAELRTAEASAPGHPLVNTTDQWTNTTLRRAIQQAVDAKAAGIAVPHGETVLSYNPGDTHGMNTFYNQIVPKNLGNMLGKLDPSIKGSVINQLETPGKGMAGSGFTYFPLTEAAIAKAKQGLPLFSMAPVAAAATLPAFLQSGGAEPNDGER